MAKPADYKTMMAELEQLLADMQSDGIAVDEALQKYERGQELVRQLQAYLKTAENTITVRKVE